MATPTSPMRVPQRVMEQAGRRPDAPAVVSGDRVTSYRQLALHAAAVADTLARGGTGPGAVVAIRLGRGADVLAAQLGVWLNGGIALVLPPDMPDGRAAAIVSDAAPQVLIRDPACAAGRGPWDAVPITVDLPEPEPGAPPVPRPRRDHPSAYLIYTSGSTGTPKGVLVGHDSFARLVAWHARAYGVTEADRASSVAAMSFDAFLWEVWPYLCQGAGVHFAPEELRMAPWELGAWYREEGISLSFLPTPLAEAYVKHGTHFGQLRCLLTGGDRLRLTDGHPLRRFVNHYGPTETTVVATSQDVSATCTGPVGIGRAIDSALTAVHDSGGPVRPGEPGELLVGGPCLAQGYWRDGEATARSFVAVPGLPGRWYRTGDLVRDDGAGGLVFLGRIDRQIKVRGVRVEPGEIESLLTRHPAVHDAVVDWDYEDARLTAYVVGDRQVFGDRTAEELGAFVRGRLPREMVPQSFVVVDRLPLTAHGKVDRHELLREGRGG